MATGSTVTTAGKKIALNRLFKSSPDYTVPSVFGIGIGTTTPTVSDTALESPVPMSGTESVDDCETADWTDSSDMTTSINSSIYKENTKALNLTKDGTGSASASTSKATTSRDFTSKAFNMWFYVLNSTVLAQLATSNCLTIRFGSDSSNYYEWTYDNADLTTGWNYISGLTSSTATTTGSPTITACDYTFIQLTATGSSETWASGSFIMDDLKVASSDDFTSSFVSGYPILDETNLQSTIRGLVSVIQLNGYPISEWGVFNTDSSPLMFNRQVFTTINKTSSIQLIFVSKDKIV